MDNLIQTICISITAALAIIALILEIVRNKRISKPSPFVRHLKYLDDVALRLCNYGTGYMRIEKIRYKYKSEEFTSTDLVEYVSQILSRRNQNSCIIWKTYLEKSDLIGRVMHPKDELVLIEYKPNVQGEHLLAQYISDVLMDISIEITYKDIYGLKHTQTCYSANKRAELYNN